MFNTRQISSDIDRVCGHKFVVFLVLIFRETVYGVSDLYMFSVI